MDTAKVTITVGRRTYLPWDADADEPTLKSEDDEVLTFAAIAEHDGEDPVEAIAAFLDGRRYVGLRHFAAVEASASGSVECIDARTWYAAEPYLDPYTGEREEATAHLDGIGDVEARAIYTALFGRPQQ